MNKEEHRIISGQRDAYFIEVMMITLLAGAVVHSGLIGYFFWLKVPEMVIYNIFSALLFVICFFAIKSNHIYSNVYFVLGSAEVILHAFLGTYYVGVDSGFPFFLWSLTPVIILHSKFSDVVSLMGCIVIGIVYVLLSEVFFEEKGIYSIDETVLKFTFYTCLFSAVGSMLAIIFYYRKVVSKKEKIILREIHHRIKNNLQMVSSIASIRNTTSPDNATHSAVDVLKTDVWYLSSMHNQISVTGRGTMINFSQFMSEVMRRKSPLEKPHPPLERNKDLYLNLETGIPLGLIASQVIEFFNAIQLKTQNVKTQFSVLSDTPMEGEIGIQLTSDDKLDMSAIRMEESSAEIISLLLEQLEGNHELIREPNSVQFLIRYRVI